MNSIKRYFRMPAVGIPIVAFMLFYGCAPVTPVVTSEGTSGVEATKSGTSISTVNIVGTGDAVLIESDGQIRYTAFRLTDPPRLVIDVPSVNINGLKFPMEVNNKYITAINASAYGDGADKITRIEIGLQDGIEYNVKAGENSILVDLKREIYAGEEAGAVTPEASASEVPNDAVDVTPEVPVAAEPGAIAEEAAAVTPSNPAKNIVKLDSYVENGVTYVRIQGDGNIISYNSFGLDAPSRVVLDISGVGVKLKKKSIAVGGDVIKGIRIGEHKDKVRFVFDAKTSKRPAHKVSKDGGTLVLQFGDQVPAPVAKVPVEKQPHDEPIVNEEAPISTVEPDIKASLNEKPVAYAEVVTSEPVAEENEGRFLVRRVVFKRFADKARLTIEGTSKPVYKLKEAKDGLSVYIEFSNAFIPEDLRLTMDATALGTQVSSVSSYQAVKPANTVRVLVKLAEQSSFTIKEGERYVVVDFPLEVSTKEGESAKELGLDDEEEGKKKYTGERIDIDLSGADVKDVIKLLAEVSGMNIIAGDDVSGTVTVTLKDVPWDQAFELVLSAKGLDKVQEGNIIRVASKDKIKKERESVLAEKATKEKLEDLVTEYISINYDKASSLSGQVKGIMTPRGTATVHDGTNTLIIKDIPSAIAEVKDFIKRVDVPAPQVLIEARIVEASTDFTRDIGVKINNISSTTPASNTVTTTQSGNTSNIPIGLTYGTVNYELSKILGHPFDLDLALYLGEQEGNVKTISRPRVVTMDNKEAKIEQGDSIPYSTTSASGTATTFVDANLSLTVTPHITPDGSISMKIKASNNTPSSAVGAGGEPGISKKEATTEVLVRDGETTVIGGIVVSTTNQSVSGVPLLKDIPIFGWLFKSKRYYEDQKELLIFITPTILKHSVK